VTAYSELRQTEWAVFLNDDWKATRNLTINAGVRYENYGTFVDKDGTLRNLIFGSGSTFAERLASARVDLVDRFYPPDNNNVAPRLGLRGTRPAMRARPCAVATGSPTTV
jgi:outer membrane receptor protein involved in Fe transport